jgi:hypothetical protein
VPFANLLPPGSLYIQNFQGVAWFQPNGVGTQVFPAQNVGNQYAFSPTPGMIVWSENSGIWYFGCGHSVMEPMIFRDYDNMLGVSVAVICCPMCSFIQRYQSPYESIDDPFQFPIIIP